MNFWNIWEIIVPPNIIKNNNLKVVITFGNFIGNDISFLDLNKKEQILAFLNTKVKNYDEDPDKK